MSGGNDSNSDIKESYIDTTDPNLNNDDTEYSSDYLDDFLDRHQSTPQSQQHFKSQSKLELIRNKFFLTHNYFNIYNSNGFVRNKGKSKSKSSNSNTPSTNNSTNSNKKNYDQLFDDLNNNNSSKNRNNKNNSTKSSNKTSLENYRHSNETANGLDHDANITTRINTSIAKSQHNNNDMSPQSSSSSNSYRMTNARLYHNLREMSKSSSNPNYSHSNQFMNNRHKNRYNSNMNNHNTKSKYANEAKYNEFSDIDTFCPIIVDNGSFRIKAGFMNDEIHNNSYSKILNSSNSDINSSHRYSNNNNSTNKYTNYTQIHTPTPSTPSVVIPNILGRKIQYGRKKRKHSSRKLRIPLIADEAHMKRESCDISYPIENGIVKNWDDIQTVWSYVLFTKLNVVHSEDYPILMTESPFNTMQNRNTMAEIMFETFNVPKLAIAMDAILELYHTGQTTGVTVSSGFGSTNIIPIYEGIPVTQAFNCLNIAGTCFFSFLFLFLF